METRQVSFNKKWTYHDCWKIYHQGVVTKTLLHIWDETYSLIGWTEQWPTCVLPLVKAFLGVTVLPLIGWTDLRHDLVLAIEARLDNVGTSVLSLLKTFATRWRLSCRCLLAISCNESTFVGIYLCTFVYKVFWPCSFSIFNKMMVLCILWGRGREV